MSDDFDYRAEKEAEMLMDYQQEMAEQEMQENCLHESISVEDSRVRVRIPKDTKKDEYILVNNYEVEAYFVCDKCNAGKWMPVDVDSYVWELDCQPDDLHN
tara:strand:+ start:189 stop:491 length:303 start_codon:yes stop_codon:yes gene_type:complete